MELEWKLRVTCRPHRSPKTSGILWGAAGRPRPGALGGDTVLCVHRHQVTGGTPDGGQCASHCTEPPQGCACQSGSVRHHDGHRGHRVPGRGSKKQAVLGAVRMRGLFGYVEDRGTGGEGKQVGARHEDGRLEVAGVGEGTRGAGWRGVPRNLPSHRRMSGADQGTGPQGR